MKRLLGMLLALCSLAGTALAGEAETDCLYAVSPAPCDMEALRGVTFGERASDAVLEIREYSYQSYFLPEEDGVPFCGAGAEYPFPGVAQTRVSVYRVAGDACQFDLEENVFPEGTLPEGMLSPQEATIVADAVAPALGLNDGELLSVVAYGRMAGATPGYKVSYLQRLNGLPVYWAATADKDSQPETNMLQVVVGGEAGEVFRASGQWSLFSPSGNAAAILSPGEALDAFRSAGVETDSVERCYWMTVDERRGAAYPAYRARNNFLDALTGELLQAAGQ